MAQEDLDELLAVIENPVRRRIIKRLSEGPAHAFQLAKELNLGQPLVAKHMKVMEERGFVTSDTQTDTHVGPERKRYSLAKSFTITMDLAPNLFIERAVPFETKPSRQKASQAAEQLRRRIQDARTEENGRERLSRLTEVLNRIDERMEGLEDERVELLSTRNQAMQEAARIVNRLKEADKRRVLFHILDEHDREVERISEALDIREVTVKEILEELESEFFG